MTCLLLWLVFTQSTKPHHVFDRPVTYQGEDSLAADIKDISEIKIGLFCPAAETSPVARSMVEGATLAIADAKEFQGVPFSLKRKWVDGPWGTSAKALLEMVYADQVWAIIGGPDSANTHLAEQIALKCRVPLLSPVSGDASLTFVRVPWIFNLAPSFQIQVEWMANHSEKHGLASLGLVYSTNLDGRLFAQEVSKRGINPLFAFSLDQVTDVTALEERWEPYKPQRVWIAGGVEDPSGFLEQHPGFGVCGWFPAFKVLKGVKRLVPTPQGRSFGFQEKYHKRFGYPPDAVAMFSYDAVTMVCQVIRTEGLSRKRIRNALAEKSFHGPLNFNYQWNPGGGNMGPFEFQFVERKNKSSQ